jgi:hypothetical protein
MELPIELQMIIKEYSRPITRPDWREGCYCNRFTYECYDYDYPFKYVIHSVYKVEKTMYASYDDHMFGFIFKYHHKQPPKQR